MTSPDDDKSDSEKLQKFIKDRRSSTTDPAELAMVDSLVQGLTNEGLIPSLSPTAAVSEHSNDELEPIGVQSSPPNLQHETDNFQTSSQQYVRESHINQIDTVRQRTTSGTSLQSVFSQSSSITEEYNQSTI